MKIKGMEGHEYNVTSQGQGTYNTVGGSAGILALLNQMGNGCNNGGILGNLFGGNGRNGDCYISEKEFAWAQAYNTKQSEVDMLKSDQRTDGKLLELYRELDRRFTLTGTEIATIAATQAVTNEKLNGSIALLDTKIDNTSSALDAKINCNVAAIYREIDCRTLPLEKKVPLSSICPEAMPKCPDVQQVQLVNATAAIQALTEAITSKK